MKRFAVLAFALSLAVAGCDKSISPVAPTGLIKFVAQLSGATNVPPAGSLETGAAGSLQVTFTPAANGDYKASFAMSLTGLVKAGVLPAPLDSGTVIVAGYVHQGAAGALGAPVVALPISLQAPIVSPTGTVLLTLANVPVPAAVAAGIIANPSGFYFNLYSALNQNGVLRGQLIKQ